MLDYLWICLEELKRILEQDRMQNLLYPKATSPSIFLISEILKVS